MSATVDTKPSGDAPVAPTAFSYAAAAKGLVVPQTSAPAQSQSGSALSANSQSSTHEQKEDGSIEEHGVTPTLASLKLQPMKAQNNDLTSPSSPEFGASSTSTLLREDDSSSTPQAPSEATTWENKSQASNQEKAGDGKIDSQDSGEKEVEEVKPAKKLQDAPPPAVNPWTKRAEEQKSRSVVQMPAAKSNAPKLQSSDAHRHSAPDARSAATRPNTERSRRDGTDAAPRRTRRASMSIPNQNESRSSGSMTAPLPSMGDSESWPTPLTAQDDDRRRSQANGQKERPQPAATTGKKPDWVSVPINPTVIFNTPISTGARRGGRGGGRGGREGGRGGLPNGIPRSSSDQIDGVTAQPTQPTTAGTAEIAPVEQAEPVSEDVESGPNQEAAPTADVPAEVTAAKTVPPPTADVFVPRAAQDGEDGTKDAQDSYAPRSFNKTKPFRRSDGAEGDAPRSHARRASGSAHQLTDYPYTKGDGNTDAAGLRQTGSDRRQSQYNSYPPRERPERGRGGRRGGLTNGFHAASTQQTLPNGYVPAHSFGQTRNFRGSSRAHSIPAEPIYGGRAMNGYAPPYLQLQPPVAGYEYGMYPIMQPMSAVPYDNGFGQHHVVNMVQTQLEYYFSVENLIRDTFLRKHMDGQGYIFLSVIAGFNRLKSLSHDYELIKFASAQTPTVEYRVGLDGRERVRKREDWQKWIMPLADRDAAAQHDGIIEYRQAPQLAAVNTNFPLRQASLPNHGAPMSAPGGHFPHNNFSYPSVNGHTEVNGFTASPAVMSQASFTPRTAQGEESTNEAPHSKSTVKATAVEFHHPGYDRITKSEPEKFAQASPSQTTEEANNPLEASAMNETEAAQPVEG